MFMNVETVLEILAATVICLKFSVHAQVERPDTYRGAVVEYYSIRTGDNPEDIFNQNANNYELFIAKASEYNADIIVFPESGLTDGRDSIDREVYPTWSSYIPNPESDTNPCIDDTDTLEAIKIVSCAARNHSIYVIVNLSEKVSCAAEADNCSNDGYLFYNTNVVFDRNGSIIARYRKYNLFGEIGFNVTEVPDLTTFETDFGVTFGVFIAFDIIFREPSLTLVRDLNVTDFIYNLHWFSALPFMTAVQTQMAWSYTLDVNLLAAGYNRPASGAGGSGIFSGRRGTIVSDLSETASNMLLIADIPRQPSATWIHNESFALIYDMSDVIATPKNLSDEITLRRDNLEPYTTLEIDITEEEHELELCDRGLCCSFYIKVKQAETLEDLDSSTAIYYRYRFAVFNGVRDYSGIRTGGIQTCAIFACTGDDLASCGRRLPPGSSKRRVTSFENISITGDFPNDEDKLQIAETLTEDLLPLGADQIFLEIHERPENRSIKFQLIEPRDDLLTFAIYGRNFAADGSNITIADSDAPGNSSESRPSSFTIVMFTLLLFKIRQRLQHT